MAAPSPPSVAGFANWVTTFAQVPSAALPPDPADNQYLIAAYWSAYANVNRKILRADPWQYQTALYNLGMDQLVNFAMDPNPLPAGYPQAPGPITGKLSGQPLPYWAGLQQQFGTNLFVPGVVIATGDESTNETLTELDQYKGYTLANLGMLKTPWGRIYLGIAASVGELWGLS